MVAISMLVSPWVYVSFSDYSLLPQGPISNLLNPVHKLVHKLPVRGPGMLVGKAPSCPKPAEHFRSLGTPILKHPVQYHHLRSKVPLN